MRRSRALREHGDAIFQIWVKYAGGAALQTLKQRLTATMPR
jgi:hypothetical protein